MQTVWRGKLTQAATKYGEVAPQAAVCCNACRTCVQTNIFTAVLAAGATAVAFVSRRWRRSTAASSSSADSAPY
jgi:hypothetical protein